MAPSANECIGMGRMIGASPNSNLVEALQSDLYNDPLIPKSTEAIRALKVRSYDKGKLGYNVVFDNNLQMQFNPDGDYFEPEPITEIVSVYVGSPRRARWIFGQVYNMFFPPEAEDQSK